MNRSLRWFVFFNLLVLTIALLLLNRWNAHTTVRQQMNERIQINMLDGLERCVSFIDQTVEFNLCAHKKTKVDIYGDEIQFYQRCIGPEVIAGSASVELCSAIDLALKKQQSQTALEQKASQVHILKIDGQTWHVASFKSPARQEKILLEANRIEELIREIWDLRDRNLVYALPTILLTLVVLSLWASQVILSPIEKLSRSLLKLSAANLNEPVKIVTKYKEFDSFVLVYEALCTRLAESFQKARRFSADAAHELRTPLTILRGNAEQLIADLPSGSEYQIRMRKMADEIERLIDMSEKLLLLSRTEVNLNSLKNDNFHVSTFLSNLAEDSLQFHPNLAVRAFIEQGVIWQCDQSLVQQLIHNLYTNAVKYNQPSGWIEFKLIKQSNQLVLSIENSTLYVAEDFAQRAFDRFYRGDSARNRDVDGMGLGLSICQEIASLHGGVLSLEVKPLPSVLFTLTAPLKTAESKPSNVRL
ncbi:MAG: ATP-binding protein [Comamonadaceae bacterium]